MIRAEYSTFESLFMKNWKAEKGKEREGLISEGIILMGEVILIFRMKTEKRRQKTEERSLGEVEEEI